jgi:hypothetical protein
MWGDRDDPHPVAPEQAFDAVLLEHAGVGDADTLIALLKQHPSEV